MFGLLAGWVHGNDGGLRAASGNLSAPWLLVALVPAWWAGSAVRGAVLGTSLTLVALVLRRHHSDDVRAPRRNPWSRRVIRVRSRGQPGLVRCRTDQRTRVWDRLWFSSALGFEPRGWLLGSGLLIGEIVVVLGLQGLELPILHVLRWGASDWRAYEVEATLGLLILAALVTRELRTTR